jgi:hypothetical protein
MDRLAGNHECAFTKMMYRLRMFLSRVDPGVNNLKDKKIVFGDHRLINNPAFKIGITFIDKWRLDTRSGHWRKAKRLELVHPSP